MLQRLAGIKVNIDHFFRFYIFIANILVCIYVDWTGVVDIVCEGMVG